MTYAPERLSAVEALTRIRQGDLSVEALARSCLDRIRARDDGVRAWAYLNAEQVLEQARALDRAGPRGPLFGLPVGIKDVFLTRDMPTQYNSPLYEGFSGGVDAACVTLLREAGALILGKTETAEFASSGRLAPTRNPHDLSRTPGGSSSGSAAAVADFHAPLALGTQTGGSVIRPASYCGVFGFKPTWGMVSAEGAKAFSPSMDTVGWFARTADDLILVNDALSPVEPGTSEFRIEGARIALCRSPVWGQADAATREALAQESVRLATAGAIVTELDLPGPFDELVDVQKCIMLSEGRATFLAEYRKDPARLHAGLKSQVENAAGYTLAQLREAHDIAAHCRRAFDAIADEFDAVLTPSTVGEAPPATEGSGAMIFNAIWSLLQTPCVNVPVVRPAGGLPLGLTVTGPRYSDRRILAVARAMR